jgi:hypothetical protein
VNERFAFLRTLPGNPKNPEDVARFERMEAMTLKELLALAERYIGPEGDPEGISEEDFARLSLALWFLREWLEPALEQALNGDDDQA